MSHMKRALDVVQDLRNLADSIEALADVMCGDSANEVSSVEATSTAQTASTMPSTSSTAPTAPDINTPTSPTDTSPTGTPKPTIVELRAFVSERSTPETRPRIKAILNRFGVAKLTELSEPQPAAA